MEDRGPSIDVSDHYPLNPNHNHHNDNNFGTYVIQVPKDRIYRTPPPENALIAERHRIASAEKASGCPITRFIVSIIIFIIFMGLVCGITLATIKKDDPKFRVERVRVKTRQKKHEFDIRLMSRNPNAHTTISFDDRGKTSLSFKNNKFAKGKFPLSEQDPNKSKDVKLMLTSSKLPFGIRKSMNETSAKSQKRVEMWLQFWVPVKMRVGKLSMKSKTISMLCRFEVNTLAKNSRILSQDCDYSTRV